MEHRMRPRLSLHGPTGLGRLSSHGLSGLSLALAVLVGLILGPSAPVAAQSPAAAAIAGAERAPPSDDPPPGAPDEAESDEDAAPEPIDTRELKPVNRPKTELPSTKEQRKTAKKKAKLSQKIKGHQACGFRVPLYEHEIVDGDMLSSIAARYGVRVTELVKLNPRVNPKALKIGKTVKVCPEIAPRLREEFTYTVKSGDTLSEIGEKYGLTPREIVALQKGKLRRKLEANRSDLRDGDELTLIVDGGIIPEFAPKNEDRGTLKVGVQLEPGRGYILKRPHLAFGTAAAVKAIKAALSRYKQTKAGNIGLVLKGAEADEVRFRTANAGNLDVPRTWALLKAFVDNPDVRAVFLDYRLQKLLYEHARSQKISEAKLDELFQYPRGKGRNFGIIRHWKGHKDHFHVRFRK
jgi:LysM repeat protein